jgi:hypothetical protein
MGGFSNFSVRRCQDFFIVICDGITNNHQ